MRVLDDLQRRFAAPHRVALAVTVVSVAYCSWGLIAATAAPVTELVKLPPHQLTAYEGSAVLVQTIGDEVSSFDFTAETLYLTSPQQDGALELLAARHLKAVDQGETYAFTERFRLDPAARPLRLEAAGHIVHEIGSDRLHMLNVYLPWEILPTFALPATGEKATTKEKISILNLAEVEAAITTSAAEADDKVEVTRELSETPKPTFDFRGNEATVVAFRQKYTIVPKSGRVAALVSVSAFEFDQDDVKIRLERTVRLEETSSASVAGDDAPAWTTLLKDFAAIEKDFQERKPSEDIEKRVKSFVTSSVNTPLGAVSGALQYRLTAFHEFFEASPAGRVLAGILDRQAPDFSLKDLDGKDVEFRAAIAKNKLTLLSFWGYG